ncbi:MAG: trypsin-like peptidase domain-containing protein [Spirochaetaceae bacterium]
MASRRYSQSQLGFVGTASVVLAVLLAIGFGLPDIPGGGSERERRTMRVYEERNASVVNINTETVSYNWFLDPVPREGDSGSGSIVEHRRYVLTNHNLVNEAASVYGKTADESRQEAEVVEVDPENDLAVLKFDPGDRELSAIPFGTSDGEEHRTTVELAERPERYQWE